ncbi:uncharacterized protein ldlrad2 isoform X3 [Poecilia reticulata]|nr:PREDICTED: low-density lipoprotein receptor class A domain-containing protein 2 isoform X3 [Poecilia reticulata]XP_017160086.1 PREDICTED: low-density lipoprotein receptor class A domain-containing protein 2 isoform X3 [Poecilia reticulata]
MIVKSHQESKKYYFVTMGTDCHLTMQASSPKDKVQFYFRFFLVYSLLRVAPLSPAPLAQESSRSSAFLNSRLDPASGESPEDPCYAGSYLQFYDGRDRNSPALGPPLCGKTSPRPVLSTGNYLTLRLVTRGTQPRVDFVGDFTSFRLGFNQSECRSEPYFTCRNGKCIPVSLVCDDKVVDNCGDGSDLEENLTTGCKDFYTNPVLGESANPCWWDVSELQCNRQQSEAGVSNCLLLLLFPAGFIHRPGCSGGGFVSLLVLLVACLVPVAAQHLPFLAMLQVNLRLLHFLSLQLCKHQGTASGKGQPSHAGQQEPHRPSGQPRRQSVLTLSTSWFSQTRRCSHQWS